MAKKLWNTYDVNDSEGVMEYSTMAFSCSEAGEGSYKAVKPDGEEVLFYVSKNSTKFLTLEQDTVIKTVIDADIDPDLLYVMYGV